MAGLQIERHPGKQTIAGSLSRRLVVFVDYAGRRFGSDTMPAAPLSARRLPG